MKRHVVIILFILLTGFLFSQDVEKYVPVGKAIYPDFVSSPHHETTRPTPNWNFSTLPTNLLVSYWDYMIGGYNNLPMSVQSPTAGNGIYITYMGLRSISGQRRVFYSYIYNNDMIMVNNEITSTNIREGYPAMDLDYASGKPIFAWHSDSDASDVQLEVNTCWDAFLEGIAGLISEPEISVNNFVSLQINGNTYTDNEFLYPSVQIGPSPIPNMKRVYILARNFTSHTNNQAPSQNPIISWADFTPEMLENGNFLTWNQTYIPELNSWNVDQIVWRQPFGSLVVGNDGKIYYVGYHTAQDVASGNIINEPDLDVFACDNYGQGTWQHYSAFSNLPSWNPPTLSNPETGFFINENGIPYQDSELFWKIQDSGHLNAVIDNNLINFNGMWTLSTSDNTYYPELNTIKEIIFDTNSLTFSTHEVYPVAGNSSANLTWQPWDQDGDGQVDQFDQISGEPIMYDDWNFCYWDENAHDGAMRFLYNNIKVTEPNSQGWMASVWQNCRRAKRFNENNDEEFAAFQTVPEIYISVSPDYGNTWSEPIIMNSVENTQLAGNRPMWVYPADQIQDMGISNEHHIGRLWLMYFHDNTWGSGSITAPVGGNDGGMVKYMGIDIEIPVVEPITPQITGTVMRSDNHSPIASATVSTGQYTATTNEQGVYTIFLPVGTYNVTGSASGYFPLTINNVHVTSYQVTQLNIYLVPPLLVSVSGVVLGENPPAAISNAVIYLFGGTQVYSGTTSNIGVFSIPDVIGNQQYHYFIMKESYITASGIINVLNVDYNLGTTILSESNNPPTYVTATIVENNNAVQVNWLLPRSLNDLGKEGITDTNRYAMKETNERDRSLIGYKIWHLENGNEGDESNWSLVAEVSASSSLVFDSSWQEMPIGAYRFAVKAQYSNGTMSIPCFSHMLLRLIYGNLEGIVTDLDSNPLPNAIITLTRISPNGSGPYITASEANGHFSYTNVWYGDYSLDCSMNQYHNDAPILLTVQANHTFIQNVALSDSLKMPTNVVAQNNVDNTVTAISWNAPRGSDLRSLNGYKIYRLLEINMENPNAWTFIVSNIQTTSYSDPGWHNAAAGIYKYAVLAMYSGNNYSPASFSNSIEMPVANSDPLITPLATRIITATPNPFVTKVEITYAVKTSCYAKFELFNISGQHIKTLNCGISSKGINHVSWDGKNELGVKVTSGIYLYRMIADGKAETKKIILLK